MFNWPKNKFAQQVTDSVTVKTAVDVVFTERYGDDAQRDGNPIYEKMVEAALVDALSVIEDKWSSHDDIYRAAKAAALRQ